MILINEIGKRILDNFNFPQPYQTKTCYNIDVRGITPLSNKK